MLVHWCFNILTKNFLNLDLCNGSQGVVKEITCEDGETAPSVPKFALVDFGDSHTGESFFLMIHLKRVVSSVSVQKFYMHSR